MRPIVVCAAGTRPEVVKLAPVIARLRREDSGIEVRVVVTGQHRGLLDQALADFEITPDHDFQLMRPGQSLADSTARTLLAFDGYLAGQRPDLVLAQGDTTSVLAAALACHYHQVPFAHVEAGLRTGRPLDPFPEEKNRVLASHLAALHFAPTGAARENLLREGIAAETVHVTGNTVVDALLQTASRPHPLPVAPATSRFLLVTLHRRENFGATIDGVAMALRAVLERNPTLSAIVPVHPNPRVREPILNLLGGHDRILLADPQGYPGFVALMKAAALILTDSGGIQEEAPSLGTPVLVVREATERSEGIDTGAVQLVGTDPEAIVARTEQALARARRPGERRGPFFNPYGDGWASERIVRALQIRFGIDPGPFPPGFSAAWTPEPKIAESGQFAAFQRPDAAERDVRLERSSEGRIQ